jgi:Flp pilus assembly protein TadG
MLDKDQKGQSLVEISLALPVLLLILVGIMDLGRAYFTFVSLADAAGEGAAYAALHPTETEKILNRTADASGGLVILSTDMISVTHGSTGFGNPITVTVEYDYDLLTPIIQGWVPDGTLTLRATSVQSILTGAAD